METGRHGYEILVEFLLVTLHTNLEKGCENYYKLIYSQHGTGV